MAAITASTSSAAASSHKASGPTRTSVANCSIRSRRAQFGGPVLGGQNGHPRPELPALLQQHVHPLVRRQADDLEALRVARHHVERAGAHRTGGTEDGQPQRLRHEAAHVALRVIRASAAGITGSRASTRSSTPPWPGSRRLLSLAPAARLTSDSTRSPTTLSPHSASSASAAPTQPSVCARPRVQARAVEGEARVEPDPEQRQRHARRPCRTTRPPSSCRG